MFAVIGIRGNLFLLIAGKTAKILCHTASKGCMYRYSSIRRIEMWRVWFAWGRRVLKQIKLFTLLIFHILLREQRSQKISVRGRGASPVPFRNTCCSSADLADGLMKNVTVTWLLFRVVATTENTSLAFCLLVLLESRSFIKMFSIHLL